MTKVNLTEEVDKFLSPEVTNEHGLLLKQQLAEMMPMVDEVDMTLEVVNIGGYAIDAVIFVLKKATYPDITVIIQQQDISCRHPVYGHPLFRGQRLIEEVLMIQARERWGINE